MSRTVPRASAGALAVALAVTVGLSPTAATAAPATAVPATSVPATAVPTTSVAFGVQPATHGRPDARHNLTYSVTPGARLRDEVAVVNIGTRPVTVDVSAVDAATTSDGSYALLPGGARSSGIGAWITMPAPSRHVTVPARTKRGPSFVVVPITVTIPRNAAPGDHGGGLAVALTGTAVNRQGVRVKLDQRVALRVSARVSGPVKPALTVRGLTLAFAGPALNGNPFATGSARVHYVVHNTGNVTLGATQRLTVSSWFGGSTTVAGMPLVPPLLPGGSMSVTRVVPDVFPGLHLTAEVTLHPVAPAGAGDPAMKDVSASTSVWAVPWTLVVLLALLLIVAGLLLWRHRRAPVGGAHRSSPRPPGNHTPSPLSKAK